MGYRHIFVLVHIQRVFWLIIYWRIWYLVFSMSLLVIQIILMFVVINLNIFCLLKFGFTTVNVLSGVIFQSYLFLNFILTGRVFLLFIHHCRQLLLFPGMADRQVWRVPLTIHICELRTSDLWKIWLSINHRHCTIVLEKRLEVWMMKLAWATRSKHILTTYPSFAIERDKTWFIWISLLILLARYLLTMSPMVLLSFHMQI